MAHGTQQASMDTDQRVNQIKAQCFTLETQSKETEIELRAQLK